MGSAAIAMPPKGGYTLGMDHAEIVGVLMKRDSKVTAEVPESIKNKAEEVYDRWGLSLSDAVNVFLVKSIDAGGFPFIVNKTEEGMRIGDGNIKLAGRFDENGHTVLPNSMYYEGDDGLYDDLFES